jgi:hypothetical protein
MVQEIPERDRPIEVEKPGSLLKNRVVADAPAFLVTRDIVPIEILFDFLRLGYQCLLHERTGQELLHKEKLVLLPVLAGEALHIERRHGTINGLTH